MLLLHLYGVFNKGMDYANSNNHVAIVNTDVELPPNWLPRLMSPIVRCSQVASSTPFTNSGTICSFPNFCKDNPLFLNLSVEKIDAAFQTITPRYQIIPTGVGFCMGINRQALKKTGFFDAETFGEGYGEENDWCRRAVKLGMQNVHVENLFVYHKHGGSFLPAQRQALMKKIYNWFWKNTRIITPLWLNTVMMIRLLMCVKKQNIIYFGNMMLQQHCFLVIIGMAAFRFICQER